MATNIVGSGVNGIFQSSNREEQELGASNPNTAYTSAPTRNQHPEQSYQQNAEGTIDPEKPNADYYSSQHPAHQRSHSLTEKDSTPSSSDTPKVGEDDTVRDGRLDRQVTDLARRFSKQSEQTDSSSKNPFEAEGDPELDVNSPSFKPRSWIKSLLHLSSRDPEHHQMRTAGFAFKNLNVHGFGTATDYQKTLGNLWLGIPGMITSMLGLTKKRRIDILTHLDGVVYPGELLVVLGPPGSGCSTFLKTVSGETHGFFVDESSEINYQGISPKMMNKDFRGENIYTAEVDVHFPNMTVGQTLSFAAQARAPRHIPGGIPRKVYADYLRDATMAVFGISHTLNTKVGNDFVRGVSGGERKRVTIAEASLAGAPLQCWDNSTRGLDSANAVEFCKTLRMSAELIGTTAAVAIYQAPHSAYDVFDKVLVLYEGRQIFFGRTTEAKPFFEEMGFWCPDRQTDADFLTSMTSPQERVVRSGFENKVPRTPDDFAAAWKASLAYGTLQTEIAEFNQAYPIGGAALEKFKASRKAQQARGQRLKSPFTLSYTQQIKLCLDRGFQRLLSDPSLTITQIIANTIMGLVVSSVFYNQKHNTGSFFSRGALLFFAILLNAFGSALEILTLYAQRGIVEKHNRYAFYHPSAEAWASMLTDMPYKIGNSICFNLVLYFMTNLRREPGAFFFFYLVSFLTLMGMSMLFRTIASVSRTLSQAMTPAAVLILGLVIYTGFALPIPYMPGWSRWINYVDLVGYSFESLMINEFYGQDFECSNFVPAGPAYAGVTNLQQVCSSVGSVTGQNFVSGGAYITSSYQYEHSHKWRNVGILCVFIVGLCAVYITATELISSKKSKGEVLLFRRGHKPATFTKTTPDDMEAATGRPQDRPLDLQLSRSMSAVIAKQTAIFSWQDVTYDIKIKKEERRILDHVDGWVKPGTLTALMGVSGAGKTTLLDVLATRVTMGVVGGEMLVDGRPRDASFQRKTGYVQQQDLHLETSTVREALNFSALLRQPAHVSRKEKLDYVEDVIKLLDMQEYADAVVGVPGEGLNVEQRKRLTIGVELAAKPQLLLFLDEPTSGLDSQTSWAICDLMEKLTKNGQAILCTIHQPSAMLFARFDRLLFLAKGGRTVYFGPVGENSRILIDYYEKNGAPSCPESANPAEWMLEVIGAAPGSHSEVDWHEVWKASPERAEVRRELQEMKIELPQITPPAGDPNDKSAFKEFAAPFGVQLWEVQKRVFAQYNRTPSYLYSKLSLCTICGLFIGFSFYNAGTSQQALQNQLFSIFMVFTIFGQLVQQILPHFVTQRALYEARERPSKTYSWKAFMISNLLVELPWNALGGAIIFFTWYYPVGLYKNAIPDHQVHERGGLMFLLTVQFLLFTSTFSTMIIAAIDDAETAGNIGNLLFSLVLIFCGVLATPSQFPHFWIFLYRLSPFTYFVDALLSVGVANTQVVCAANEYLRFDAPAGQTCRDYMSTYISQAGGYLLDPNAMGQCQFCAVKDTNVFLAQVSSSYSHRWRNFGIIWAFIIFNAFAAVFLYWLARVPKGGAGKKDKKLSKKQKKNAPIAAAAATVAPMQEKDVYQQQPSQQPYHQGNDIYQDGPQQSLQVAAMRATGMTEKEEGNGVVRGFDGHT